MVFLLVYYGLLNFFSAGTLSIILLELHSFKFNCFFNSPQWQLLNTTTVSSRMMNPGVSFSLKLFLKLWMLKLFLSLFVLSNPDNVERWNYSSCAIHVNDLSREMHNRPSCSKWHHLVVAKFFSFRQTVRGLQLSAHKAEYNGRLLSLGLGLAWVDREPPSARCSVHLITVFTLSLSIVYVWLFYCY